MDADGKNFEAAFTRKSGVSSQRFNGLFWAFLESIYDRAYPRVGDLYRLTSFDRPSKRRCALIDCRSVTEGGHFEWHTIGGAFLDCRSVTGGGLR